MMLMVGVDGSSLQAAWPEGWQPFGDYSPHSMSVI